ncbi:MAG: gluconate 2-dehydrogenase subunit 3 family protein [Gammaproteobacteria bacterium]|nr:gluconate 2-dehydrogenase subunit 3 family protein [Gammaproteobacteria bacterium]
MKTRREILQGLIVSIGGSSLLTACDGFAKIAPTVDGELRFYSSEEIELVTKISDLIIPRTDTPGASDVNVSGFLDGLMAEWANAETRENHHRDIKRIGGQLGDSFRELDEQDAKNKLANLDTRAYAADRPDEYSAYRSLKGLITQAYFASEEGRLLEQQWVAVPGRWNPRVEI